MHKSKKTSQFRVTGLYEGNSPVTHEFPVQRSSKTANGSVRWRHHETHWHHVYLLTNIVLFHWKTCVAHAPWCMWGSLTRGGKENIPGIPAACATRYFTYPANLFCNNMFIAFGCLTKTLFKIYERFGLIFLSRKGQLHYGHTRYVLLNIFHISCKYPSKRFSYYLNSRLTARRRCFGNMITESCFSSGIRMTEKSWLNEGSCYNLWIQNSISKITKQSKLFRRMIFLKICPLIAIRTLKIGTCLKMSRDDDMINIFWSAMFPL